MVTVWSNLGTKNKFFGLEGSYNLGQINNLFGRTKKGNLGLGFIKLEVD